MNDGLRSKSSRVSRTHFRRLCRRRSRWVRRSCLPMIPSNSPLRRPTPASCSGWQAAWRRPIRSTRSATCRLQKDCPPKKSSALSRRSTRWSTTSRSTKGLENIAQVMDRGTLIRSARAGRSRAHPALAASVSLAHRLRAAADGRRAAHRCVDGEGSRPAQPGDAGLHQHRPAARRRRREGGAQGFHTGGFFGSEYGPFNSALSRRRDRRPSSRRRA